MKRDEKNFFTLLLTIIFILIGVIGLNIYFLSFKEVETLKIILIIITATIGIFTFAIIWSIFIIYRVINGKKISASNYRAIKSLMGVLFPILIGISKIFKIDKNSIRRVFAEVNNFLVMTKNIKVRNNEILILLPHCLQDSKCEYKITNDINNCRRCGKCDIDSIIEICNKYNVKAIVATGGTLAREWIKKTKPKAIIAVACERDLASGINDVKILPVYGITNERPNGPCFDTKVDVRKIENAIKDFLKEG
ncbi:DUF116 domain-containing protein [Thermohalobacter berrensis]|uniref:DUF116 domain-containing protein n=1 Tax=Thermohalobacter berrensis TaxID=99594 RepID=A0A419TA63_9FIRM|nr:DUF116 domain-containing protein [Thermohalobacter berrensis]RKD34362.1 hypothetical protein BET03_00580 [Thermohalobacter berrensis]